MGKYSLTFAVLLLTVVIAASQEIEAIEAGTITVEDKFIRLNTCITKTFELEMRRQYYDRFNDISAIASIAKLKMDDELTFQFTYNLNCLKPRCVFEVQFQRFNPKVNPLFSYEVKIDFLVAHGIQSMDVNMTYFRQIVDTPLKTPFERAILIPNGFNKMSMTGNIDLRKIQDKNFILSYSEPDAEKSRQYSKGWPLNKNFVLYKVVFLFHSYKVANNIKNLFSGFLHSQDSKVITQYQVNKQTLEIISTSSQGKPQYFFLPFGTTSQFKDHRAYAPVLDTVLAYSPQTDKEMKVQSSSSFTPFIIGFAILLAVKLTVLTYRNRKNKERRQAGDQKAVHLPQIFISQKVNIPTITQNSQLQENPCESAGSMSYASETMA